MEIQTRNLNVVVFLLHPYGFGTWRCAIKGRKRDRERGRECGLVYMTSSYFPQNIFLSISCIGTGSAAEVATQNVTVFRK